MLLPEPGETTVESQLDGYRPWEELRADRPFVAVNFAATIDGSAAVGGRSGPIGSDLDTAMLVGLRGRFDAVMIGAGTLRAERYGRVIPNPSLRARRERIGLPHDPLAVIVSASMDLPWDAPIFTVGAGRVLIVTSSDKALPETETAVRAVRHEGEIDLVEALRHLRVERGIRAVLCEGGPTLHGELQRLEVVDDLFLTTAPKLGAGDGPSILRDGPPELLAWEIAWLLEEKGELFTRYRRPEPGPGSVG